MTGTFWRISHRTCGRRCLECSAYPAWVQAACSPASYFRLASLRCHVVYAIFVIYQTRTARPGVTSTSTTLRRNLAKLLFTDVTGIAIISVLVVGWLLLLLGRQIRDGFMFLWGYISRGPRGWAEGVADFTM